MMLVRRGQISVGELWNVWHLCSTGSLKVDDRAGAASMFAGELVGFRRSILIRAFAD